MQCTSGFCVYEQKYFSYGILHFLDYAMNYWLTNTLLFAPVLPPGGNINLQFIKKMFMCSAMKERFFIEQCQTFCL